MLRFGNKLKEEVTISLGEVMLKHYSRQFGDNFQDLVTKMNLVALAPVLGAISHPVN